MHTSDQNTIHFLRKNVNLSCIFLVKASETQKISKSNTEIFGTNLNLKKLLWARESYWLLLLLPLTKVTVSVFMIEKLPI